MIILRSFYDQITTVPLTSMTLLSKHDRKKFVKSFLNTHPRFPMHKNEVLTWGQGSTDSVTANASDFGSKESP
jgi:hypothetical protein